MLMPKKVKHRKQMRGRMTGVATRGSEISFGEYGLKCLEPRERFLLLANTFHCIDFAERQLELEPKERLTQTRCLGAQFVFAQLTKPVEFFSFLHC